MDAPILKVIPQRHAADCGVATLAMICGVSYEDALVAVAAEEPAVLTRGVHYKHLERAALRLGFRFRRRRRYDLDTDTGILNLSSTRLVADHLVVLKEGLIIETDGSLYDADVYFAHLKARPGILLVAEPL